jgi:saccharopine dehydrogenase-like NADP-dependent oxidoreductase
MTKRVLILGGRGRIGSSIAADLLQYAQAEITITGRTPDPKQSWKKNLGDTVQYLPLDLSNAVSLAQAISSTDLVIHCAGPFRYRDGGVLKTCIEQGVNYVDVSDDRRFTQMALSMREAAQAAGVTAIVNSGVFPGISNSMVRQAVEQLDTVEKIHLSYVVAGSGGAGVTVLRTTFLGLQHPFDVWLDGKWQTVRPYTGRETIEFPAPFGKVGVYWFDMPEAFTLVDAFPARSVIVKFGSAPDFYNHLTALVANWFPKQLVQNKTFVEILSNISHTMTDVTDGMSGIGVAMRADVRGEKAGQPAHYTSAFVNEHTSTAVGYGTGSLAELMLTDRLSKPGVWAVEDALPTDLFEQIMDSRGVKIAKSWET